MPNIKSAKKRVDVTLRNKEINKSNKSELNTALKKMHKTIEAGDKKQAETALSSTFKILDENVTKGTIHKNKADRKKAEVAKKVSQMK